MEAIADSQHKRSVPLRNDFEALISRKGRYIIWSNEQLVFSGGRKLKKHARMLDALERLGYLATGMITPWAAMQLGCTAAWLQCSWTAVQHIVTYVSNVQSHCQESPHTRGLLCLDLNIM